MNSTLLTKLIGGSITHINRVCDLISIEIQVNDESICLHIQSFLRILKNNRVIISSEDMYRCGNNCSTEKFEWDIPGNSIFDESVKKYKTLLFQSKILELKIQDNGDCIIIFENNLVFQIFIDTVCPEEKYRIFNDDDSIIIDS